MREGKTEKCFSFENSSYTVEYCLLSLFQVSVFVSIGSCYLKVVDDGNLSFFFVYLYFSCSKFVATLHVTFSFSSIFMVSMNGL